MSARYRPRHPELSPQDRADVEAVMRDRFQSPRARARAHALLLTTTNATEEAIASLSGITPKLLEAMLLRLRSHGVRGALFGVEREKRRYDVKAVSTALQQLVAMRPPEGVYWTQQALTEAVRSRVPGAEDISCEYVRQVMVRKLGIRSVRHIEPYWLRQTRKAALPAG